MSVTQGVILTGGDFQGLAALRALTRNNIPVVLVDHEHCISRVSRYRHRFFRAPPPKDDEAYCQFLLDLAVRENLQGWLIFPNSDELVYVLSKNRDSLQQVYRVSTPSWEVIQHLYVKKSSYELAKSLGINMPTSYFPTTIGELRSLDLIFPVIIKPSIRDHLYQQEHVKAYRADNRAELEKIYSHICRMIDPSEVIVQDLIPGGPEVLYSFCPFFKEGRVVASITARRSRQHPMTFGHASTFVELANIPELETAATRLLEAIGYYGLCEVEFMHDERDDTYKFLEVNPRIWGWHGLAIAAGVNLPALLYADTYGLPLETVIPADELKWVRLLTDIPTVLGEMLKGRLSISKYISSMKGPKAYAVWSFRDPLPFIVELLMLPYLFVKRGF